MNSEIINSLFIMARDHDSHGKAKIAAAIYDRKKLISFGFNDYTHSHPLQKRYGTNDDSCFLHAEISAILNSRGDDLRNKTLYIVRARKIGGHWQLGLSAPCPGCRRAIRDYGFRTVIFSLNERGYGVLENV